MSVHGARIHIDTRMEVPVNMYMRKIPSYVAILHVQTITVYQTSIVTTLIIVA